MRDSPTEPVTLAPITAFDELIHRAEQFANRTKATPVATGLSIVQMMRVFKPKVIAELQTQARADANAEPLRLLGIIDGIVDDTHPEGDGCPLCSTLDDLRQALSATPQPDSD